MTAFFMAWMMYCYIPCPVKKWDKTKSIDMLLCLPIIGLLIGLVASLIMLLISKINLVFVPAAFAVFLTWALSGFFHLDGFMDCADALMSRRDLERRLEILKDSHVGAFAVIALVVLSLISFSTWLELGAENYFPYMILIPASARAAASNSILIFKPLEHSSFVSMHEEGIPKGKIAISFVISLAILAAAFFFFKLKGIAVLAAYICSFLAILRIKTNFKGMSGDVSGCGITIGEVCGAMALLLF